MCSVKPQVLIGGKVKRKEFSPRLTLDLKKARKVLKRFKVEVPEVPPEVGEDKATRWKILKTFELAVQASLGYVFGANSPEDYRPGFSPAEVVSAAIGMSAEEFLQSASAGKISQYVRTSAHTLATQPENSNETITPNQPGAEIMQPEKVTTPEGYMVTPLPQETWNINRWERDFPRTMEAMGNDPVYRELALKARWFKSIVLYSQVEFGYREDFRTGGSMQGSRRIRYMDVCGIITYKGKPLMVGLEDLDFDNMMITVESTPSPITLSQLKEILTWLEPVAQEMLAMVNELLLEEEVESYGDLPAAPRSDTDWGYFRYDVKPRPRYTIREELLRYAFEYLYTYMAFFREAVRATNLSRITYSKDCEAGVEAGFGVAGYSSTITVPQRLGSEAVSPRTEGEGAEGFNWSGSLGDALAKIGIGLAHEEIEIYLLRVKNYPSELRGVGKADQVTAAYLWEWEEMGFFDSMARMQPPHQLKEPVSVEEICKRHEEDPWRSESGYSERKKEHGWIP